MSPDAVMLLFDIIILIYGGYGIYSAFHMKKTGIPSKILVSREDINKIKNADGFCKRMYQPTLVFGGMACMYSVVELLNQYVIKRGIIDLLCAICFVIVCVWYCKELRRARENQV